jgi:small-conductance mechanosensitive channel
MTTQLFHGHSAAMSLPTFKIDFTRGVEDAWSKIATLVPKLASFLVVLLLGLFVTKLIARVVRRLAERAKLDAVLDRAGVGRYVRKTGMTPSVFVSRIVKWILTFIVVSTAFSLFGPQNPVSRYLNSIVSYLPKVVVALIILGITSWLVQVVTPLMARVAREARMPGVVAKIAPIAIWVIGGFAAVDQIGVAPNVVHALFYGALAVIVGSAIVAIGGGGIAPMRQQWDKWLAKNTRS